jgi:cytoskeletal protein CcmA (bactofilin family)/prefoldin subunit 5
MSNNTSYGIGSLYSITDTATDNTAIGAYASYHNTTTINNTAIGSNSAFFNTTGSNNTSLGAGSLCTNVSGSLNTAIGSSALDSSANITNQNNQNVAVGAQSLYSIIGNLNTAIGTYAGMNIDGSGNTFLGANTGFDLSKNTYNFSSAIGYNALITQSNQIVLGTNTELVSVPGNMNVSGNVHISGDLSCNTITSIDASLNSMNSSIISIDSSLNSIIESLSIIDSSLNSINNSIISIDSSLTLLAPINSPPFKGNVGINITNPNTSYALDVSGNVHISGDLSCNTIHAYGSATLNGNVGIGKPSTGYALDVSGQLNCSGINTFGQTSLATNYTWVKSFLMTSQTNKTIVPSIVDPDGYNIGAIGGNYNGQNEVNFWNLNIDIQTNRGWSFNTSSPSAECMSIYKNGHVYISGDLSCNGTITSPTIISIDSSLNSINSSIISIDSSLNSMNKSINSIDSSLNSIIESLSIIDSSLNSINNSIISIDSSLNSINNSIISIDSSLNSINNSIISIDSSLTLLAPINSPPFKGNVGINITTPNTSSYALDVSGNVHISGDLSCNTIHAYGSATLNGTVGIGKPSTGYALDVSGQLNCSGNITSPTITTINTNIALCPQLNLNNNMSGNNTFGQTSLATNYTWVKSFLMTSQTNENTFPPSVASIDPYGYNIGAIGGNINGKNEVNFWNLQPSNKTSTDIGWSFNTTGNPTGSNLECMSIYKNGTVTATIFSALSDYRIKENIIPLNETHIIDNLNPVTYMNLKSGKQDIGLIAHELQEVYPELVTGTKDGEDMQSVNYMGLIPILIKEIQELKRREKLTSDILARIWNIIN